MAFNYLVPSIMSFPSGVGCCLPIPWTQVGEQLRDGSGAVVLEVRAIRDGEVIADRTRTVSFANGKAEDKLPSPEILAPFSDDPYEEPAFIECSLRTVTGAPLFTAKSPLVFYSIYASPGQKSYFSDNAWKYAAPPVIQQIAEYGSYTDAYPTVLVDQDRDLGMSVLLINPYMKDIICRIFTHDGRKPLRTRVPSMSARRADLKNLLGPSERRWRGQIQLTANNRLVTYIAWHSLRNPAAVSDQEHLDPYRGEDTHIPATLNLRRKVGAAAKNLGILT